MNLNYRFDLDKLIVEFEGEIDEYSCRTLRAELDSLIETPRLRAVIFDMGKVTFVDSTGLGLILGRYKKLNARGVELLLKRIPSHVDKVFRTSGIYSVAPKID